MALPSSSVTFSNQILIPSLPNDISIQILARVPPPDHRSLSLVSKAFHSLLTSPLFFTTRSLINSTETTLFVTLRSNDDEDIHSDNFTDHLFALHRHRLVPLPRIPRCRFGSTYAACGPCIYVLGGYPKVGVIDDDSFEDVRIFDCRFNKWATGPSMHFAKRYPMVGVVDGKLHVVLGRGSNKNNGEVYDPNMGTWEATECFRDLEISDTIINAAAVVGRKIYGVMICGGLYGYDVDTKVCKMVTLAGPISYSCCIIDGVLYVYDYKTKTIRGFDLEKKHWKEVRGVRDMWDNATNIQLVTLEGKLVTLWGRQKDDNAKNYWEVWYMEIDVKKDEKEELRGNVCFKKLVLNFSYTGTSCELVNCSAAAF